MRVQWPTTFRAVAWATSVSVGLGVTAVPVSAVASSAAAIMAPQSDAASSSSIAQRVSAAFDTGSVVEAASFPDGLDVRAVSARMSRATTTAAARGASVSAAVLDRETGSFVWNGNNEPIATASVSKLFIADDLLFRSAAGEVLLPPDDRATIDLMLRASDDGSAESLWSRYGRESIVARVADRYGLTSTQVRLGDAWWNTTTTMTDLVDYYASLAGGRGGLDAQQTGVLIGGLAAFTDRGTDGYDQRFGIPDALQSVSAVAVKQGWMCCVDGRWLHLSTGYVGPGNRFVVAVGSREISAGWAESTSGRARATVTEFLDDVFSEGSTQR